jgi:hypothetical protein
MSELNVNTDLEYLQVHDAAGLHEMAMELVGFAIKSVGLSSARVLNRVSRRTGAPHSASSLNNGPLVWRPPDHRSSARRLRSILRTARTPLPWTGNGVPPFA